VSKVDIEEIYAPMHKQARLMLMVIIVLILTSSLSIIFWWRQKSAEYVHKQQTLELEQQYLSSRYTFLSKYANDIILFIDPSGQIVEANDRAVTAYGYSHDELLQLHVRDLRPAELRDEVDGQMQKVRDQGGLLFETIHRRKDGTKFPVEVSSRLIDLGDKPLFQSVIRDVSERKQAEAALINERNRSNAIIAAIGDGITIQDRDFRIIYQNQIHKATYGDHVGKLCYEAYQHRKAVCDACIMAQTFLDGEIHRAMRSRPAEPGRPRHIEVTSSPLRDETGEIVAGIEVVRDITEQLRVQTSLKERNAFIEAIMDSMPIGLAVNSINDGKVVYMNAAFETIYGWPRQSMGSMEEFFTSVYPDPLYRKEIKGRVLSDIASGDPARMRWENIPITTSQGQKRIITAINIPLFDQGIMISTVQDVTAHRQAEDRLAKINECFLSFGPDPDENINRLVALSGIQLDAACALYNRLDGDTLFSLGQWNTPPDYIPRDKPDGHICYDVIREGGNDVCVIRDLPATSYMKSDPNVARYGLKTYIGKAVSFGGKFVGSLCVVYQDDRVPSDDELKFLGIVAAAVGVEENRKGTIKALADSENRYKHLIESVTDYIYTVEVENGRPVSTIHGSGCVAVTGYTSDEYHTDPELWLRMIVEEDRDLVLSQSKKILAGLPIPPFEHRIIHKDGSLHWVRNTQVPRFDGEGHVTAYDGLISDITQLKMLENQLRQAQKMEAVGQLSGGIAHDFNNILTAIIGYANLLLMKMSKDDELGRSYVEQILSSSERAAHLTHSLLAFSRKQIIDLRPINLSDIIKRVEKLLIRVIGEDIEFKIRLAADLPILADSVHIEQVFMNLATNARDAMPDGGTLLIKAEPVDLKEDFVRTHTYIKPGRYAAVIVTDTGIGMDEMTKSRIFEPFFTTKEVGKGTGLGLSMVYGIIKQHKGYILVSSVPGKGTTFTIYLPLITAQVEKPKPKEHPVIERGTETVLIAEDDTAVRALTKNILEDFGYKVIEAVDGEEAVRKFIENKDTVKLLIFDIIMPKKNGKDAYVEIRKIRPDVKSLFVSGYTADIIHQKGILETGLDFIVKPIAPGDFLKKVRDVLEK
jgi:PAS domain S-box-containing protein